MEPITVSFKGGIDCPYPSKGHMFPLLPNSLKQTERDHTPKLTEIYVLDPSNYLGGLNRLSKSLSTILTLTNSFSSYLSKIGFGCFRSV